MKKSNLFRKLKFVVMSLLLLCSLAGCGQVATPLKNEGENINTGRPQSENVYQVEIVDLQITPDLFPINGSLCATPENLYFRDERGDCYRQELLRDSTYAEVFGEMTKEDAEEEHIRDFRADEENIYCLGNKSDGNWFFRIYDLEGKQFSEVYFPMVVTQEWENTFLGNAVTDKAGNIYVNAGAKVFLFDRKGKSLGEASADTDAVLGLAVSKEGKVFAAYQNRAQEMILAEVDSKSRKFVKETVIYGNGRLFTGVNGGILFYDNSQLFEYLPTEGRSKGILDWAEHDINAGTIWSISGQDEANLRVIAWDCQVVDTKKEPVELLFLTQTTREEKEKLEGEKEEIVVFTMMTNDIELQEVAVEFNKKSSKYRVVLEQCDPVSVGDVEVFANTRLMGKDCPDLISVGANFHIYQEAGVLEDLTPFLEASDKLSKEDFLDVAMQPCQSNDAIYGLPKEFSVGSFMGRASQVKNARTVEGGLSIDSYVSWLEENQDAKVKRGWCASEILDYCMLLGMDRFVDFENKICDFEGEEFRQLLNRLEGVQLECVSYGEFENLVAEGKKIWEDSYIDNFDCIVKQEVRYGEEAAFLGYPTSDGDLKTRLQVLDLMAILNRSTQKAGAWEFLEFYILYENEYGFPARKARFEEEFARVSEVQYTEDKDGNQIPVPYSYYVTVDDATVPIYSLSKEQTKQVLEMIECAEEVPTEVEVIISIISEELLPYWNKEKSLDTALDAIQNRVSLYLSE